MAVKSEDVAAAAGVSRATVSQILNGRGERFSVATREKVQRVAAELDYQPSLAARALAKGSSDIVLGLIPDSHISTNLQEVLEAAAEGLQRHGYTLLLRLTTPTTDSLEALAVQLQPRAVISLLPLTAEEQAALARHKVAIVGASDDDGQFDRMIGRIQADHLVSRGYRQLAYVHSPDPRYEPWGTPREAGLREVAAERGLPTPIVDRLQLDASESSRVIGSLPERTGVACYNDDIAIALMVAARVRGREVPGDIGLIGFDSSPLAAITSPRLTTMTIDVELATRGLLGPLAQVLGLPSTAAPTGLRLPHLVEGESA
ncbi:MAG: LacI family transcriptional regulator [Promicromonosporaceae bacterium]|nr:LacI family transcriptional regulator [Promicromonosporaceae bacterium]